jgi:NADPH:quinone reductase-like Zn-dependent oxidoreductase
MQKEAVIIGVMAQNIRPEVSARIWSFNLKFQEFRQMAKFMVDLFEKEQIIVHVGRVLSLGQIADAHRLILESGAQGKIVVSLERK